MLQDFLEQHRGSDAPNLWECHGVVETREHLLAAAKREAHTFQERYESQVQFIFGHVQHHWHMKDSKGNEVPMKYCRPYGKQKVGACCKRGFPKYVFRTRDGHVDLKRVRPRVICPGVAKKMKLRCSGRRNMLGAIVGKRQDSYFSGTSPPLAFIFESNTNLQVPYRLPIAESTHDIDCTSSKCLSQKQMRKIAIATQRAQKNIGGYWGGYIAKRQKTGQFELKKSIETLPLLKSKLEEKALPSAGHNLAHICNRMFTTLEGKGMLRTGTEEFMLAVGYRANDELAAEFVRTCRHQFFQGRFFLERFEALIERTKVSLKMLLPKTFVAVAETDSVSLYGFRSNTPAMFFLSPWEFCQEFKPHRVRLPTLKYKLSKWLQKPEPGNKERILPGVHYGIDPKYIKAHSQDVFLLPPADDLCFEDEALDAYKLFRQTWVLLRRTRPVVPCPENTPLPRRFDSKEKKAIMFSVYLRPWTLIQNYATAEVPYLPELKSPSCRSTWKQYLSRVLPASLRQIQNFLLATLAEGRIDADDEDAARPERLSGIRCFRKPNYIIS
jgi:hypothetical protein